MANKKDRLFVNAVWLSVNFILLIIGALFSSKEYLYIIISIIGLVQLLIAVFLYKKIEGRFFSAIVVYTIVMYLFLFGQCFVWLFTKDYSGRNILEYYEKADIVNTQIFTLVSLFFFHLACLNTGKKNSKKDMPNTIYDAIRKVGTALFFVSIIPEITFNIRLFSIAYSDGYLGLYNNTASGLLLKFLNLREFFFPSLILLLVGNKNGDGNKVLIRVALVIVIVDMLIGLYVGSRGDALTQLLSLLLLWTTYSGKKMQLKYIVLVTLAAVVSLLVINIVREVRTQSNRGIDAYVSALSSVSIGNDVMTQTVGEMGNSMSTCIETMKLVPEQFPYKYGRSYLYSFTWFLPDGINMIDEASMNNWIDSVRYTGSGWGFSTTAEAYFNFGKFGVLIFIFFGIFVAKFFKGLNNELLLSNPLEFALSFILFTRIITFSRMDFLSALPSFIYFYVLLKIIILLVNNRMQGKVINEKN